MMIFRRRAPPPVGVLAVLVLFLLTGLASAAPTASATANPAAVPVTVPTTDSSPSATVLSDDTTVLGGASGLAPIADLVQPGIVGPTFRSYTIEVRVGAPQAGQTALLETSPVVDWSSPSQVPGGPDALPPLSEWSWTVTSAGDSDTANWSVNPATQVLQSTVAWQNATFSVNGTFVGTETVTVSPGIRDGTTPTTLSVSLNGWSPGTGKSPGTVNLTAAATALDPTIVRFGMTSSGISASWNTTSGTPTFDFAHFDTVVGFIASLGAVPLLSLPAGTWGDGNVLPSGMPLNLGTPIPFNGTDGYFADPNAFSTYVEVLAVHIAATRESVPYWEVGNEVPLLNVSEVATFADLITAAATTIHASLPNARVSADTITSKPYLGEFANTTSGVGFLSFHYYASNSLCSSNGSYCAPGTFGLGDTDADLMDPSSNISHAPFLAPPAAQAEWFALTGMHLPILDTESNLNAAGGSGGGGTGSDPRIQTLFGAAWLGSTLIDASRANVSSLTYFRLTNPNTPNGTQTAPYGGFGFGLTTLNLSGQFVEFAPYWASYLWATEVQSAGSGVVVNVTGASDVVPYAVRDGTHVAVVLVNRMATAINTTVEFPNASEWSPTALTVLDSRGYTETFNGATNSTSVERSGVVSLAPPASGGTVAIDGYGMALLTGRYAPANDSDGSGNSTNSTNSTNTTSPGNQTGSNSTASNLTGGSGSPLRPPANENHGRSPTGSAASDSALSGAAAVLPGVVLGLSVNRWAALGILGVAVGIALAAWGSSAPLPPVPHARPPPRRRGPSRR